MVKKLQFASRLYIGENLGINTKKLDKLKKNLEKKPLLSNVYVLALGKNPYHQLEIYDAKQLAQSYYRKYPPYIVGIAADYTEAVHLVEQMTAECIRARGDCRLKEFLLCRP